MVTPTGFEPVTCPLGGGCSIQLSHGVLRHVYRKTPCHFKQSHAYKSLYFQTLIPQHKSSPLQKYEVILTFIALAKFVKLGMYSFDRN